MKKIDIALLACALLPVAGAWQDDPLNALAAKAGDISALPLQAYYVSSTHSIADFKITDGLMAGVDLWQQEVPELLRRTAETGDATLRSAHGFTALQAACLVGDAALIEALVEKGAPVNIRPDAWEKMSFVGDEPLALLLRNQSLSVEERLRLGRLLLEHGAEADTLASKRCHMPGQEQAPYREKLFEAMQVYKNPEWPLCMLLLEYGEQDMQKRFAPGELKIWMLWTTRDFIRAALKRGVPCRAFAAEKALTLLKRLVLDGDVELVQLALEKGASPNEPYRPYFDHAIFLIRTEVAPQRKEDPLPELTPERAVEIAKLLLDHGADINALDYEGNGVRIHYGKQKGPIAEALCAFFKERGAVLHPDARRSGNRATHRSKVPNKKIKG